MKETKFTIKTTPFEDGRIAQDIFLEKDDLTQRIAAFLVDTREAQIREALIQLGWTPPPSEPVR